MIDLAGLPALRAEHLGAFVVIADHCIQCVFIAYLAVSILLSELYSEVLRHFHLLFYLLLHLRYDPFLLPDAVVHEYILE